jgi:hypothetical protein
MLMCAESVGVIILCEQQNVTTLTIQIITSMKNCASTQYENEHELFVTCLLKFTKKIKSN